MRILAYALVLLAAAFALIYVVGRSLPLSHVASLEERFDAPRDSVFAVLEGVADYPKWRRDVTRVEILPPVAGNPSWRESNGRDRVEYVADQVVVPERWVTRITSEGLPYGGRWIFELTPDSGGTRVTITEEGEVYNPLFRFMMTYVFGATMTIERYLDDLGKRVARH